MTDTALRVLRPGLLTTIQDGGRIGWEAYGVPRGGARDFYAYVWANRLAANPPDAAVLEATLTGPTLTVTGACWIATTGATRVSVDGHERPGWSAFSVREGSTVAIEQIAGARAYVAAHGGIAVPPVLGSRSTDLESGFGGREGRGLRAGDTLPLGEAGHPPTVALLRHPRPPTPCSPFRVRAVRGPHEEEFSAETYITFADSIYRVSARSNHVGLRLDGPALTSSSGGARVSEPMPVGGIQVTPSGGPIVLLNARGTMGGYPVIATVCSTDVWALGQARPGDSLRFQLVTVDEAQAIARQAYDELERVEPVSETG